MEGIWQAPVHLNYLEAWRSAPALLLSMLMNWGY